MAFDRSKFKGAKLSANKESQKSAQENNKSYGNENRRADFHTIEEGKNVFRIFPPHESGPAYVPKRTSQLQCEVPIWKDGEDTGKTEVKGKHVFIATQHGGLPKDPIELFVEYVIKKANDEIQDKEDKAKFLAPIKGYRGADGKWNWGISPNTSYVTYAAKGGKVGRLELYESMIKDMDKCAIGEDADDVIDVDPFSDPNEGCELFITKEHEKDKSGKETKKWTYTIDKGIPARRESWDDYYERTAITDAQLEEFDKLESLQKLCGKDIYTKRDWDLALDGLKRLDDKEKYEIFDNDEFLDELTELEKLVKEPEAGGDDIARAFPDKKKDEPKGKPAKETKADKKEEKQEEPEEDAVTPTEMKLILKRHIKKEFGEEFVSQIPTDNKELAKWYCLYDSGDDLPIKTKEEPVEDKTPDKSVNDEDAVSEDKLSSQINALRARRNKK